jgi:ABC-type phosphate transport system permease subunit
MILPTIIAVSEEALKVVPLVREGSLALVLLNGKYNKNVLPYARLEC